MVTDLQYDLRKFQPDDLPRVKQLVHHTIETIFGGIYSPEVIDYWKQLHTPQKIFRDVVNGHAIVLVDGDKIIATGTLVGTTIKRLFIDPGFQRQGLGNHVMNYLENHALENGHSKVFLDSADVSKAFYLQRGYQIELEETIAFQNHTKVNYYKMSKSLLSSSERLFNYHKKVFRPFRSTGTGLADHAVLYHFQQASQRIWGTFKGGQIDYGQLLGLCQPDGSIKTNFHYIARQGQLIAGSGTIKPTRLTKGHLKLGMNWKFAHAPYEEGIMVLKELILTGYEAGSPTIDALNSDQLSS